MTVIVLTLTACGEQASQPTMTEDKPVSAEVALQRSASADSASVFFITPHDGDTVSNPVQIEFGVNEMTIVKAGVAAEHSGHHHLLVDTALPDPALPIPADANHIHFGDGSTSTEISLDPGEHTLQLLLGDHLHIPHDPPVSSEVITITVE